MMTEAWVVGAGLAGSEAAWQLSERGIPVRLFEMRPHQKTSAHHTSLFAELVCSNSLRGAGLENAVGLLKEELRRVNSLIMQAADHCRVEAGGALAVDRNAFASFVTAKIEQNPLITVVREEVKDIPVGQPCVIATGPLTSPALADWLKQRMGQEYLYFYDAAAPILTRDSIDDRVAFFASRYDKGEAVYINCPMNEEEYETFWNALRTAECFEGHLPEEKAIFFEGCMPIEVLANRGRDTLRYGPMKPVGIKDREGRQPYAVVQLRPENREGTLYNLVGFQTHLRRGEQERVFRLIPGLERAEFARYGMIHRNTYINAPKILRATLQWNDDPSIFLAGQMTGVEGYVESTAAGYVAGLNLARSLRGMDPVCFPQTTATGALLNYIATADARYFQPMNVNFGLLPPFAGRKIRPKFRRYQAISFRALRDLNGFIGQALG